MAFPRYLAMTAAEFAACAALPPHTAWMACHFSCYGTGLTNLPQELPENSMLIVNDRTSIQAHDPVQIAQQLLEAVDALKVCRVLLDFQRPDISQAAAIADAISKALPCPVGISQLYAGPLDCPVFLPPPPLHTPLEEYLLPWKSREIWLEAALDAETITLTTDGSFIEHVRLTQPPKTSFPEHLLHCRYDIDISADAAVFTLYRTEKTLETLLKEAQTLGVTCAVGLYQELGDCT